MSRFQNDDHPEKGSYWRFHGANVFRVLGVADNKVIYSNQGVRGAMPLNTWRYYRQQGGLTHADPLELLGVAGGALLDGEDEP